VTKVAQRVTATFVLVRLRYLHLQRGLACRAPGWKTLGTRHRVTAKQILVLAVPNGQARVADDPGVGVKMKGVRITGARRRPRTARQVPRIVPPPPTSIIRVSVSAPKRRARHFDSPPVRNGICPRTAQRKINETGAGRFQTGTPGTGAVEFPKAEVLQQPCPRFGKIRDRRGSFGPDANRDR